MSPISLIHIPRNPDELVIRLDSISFVRKDGGDVEVYFLGDDTPLVLKHQEADAFWVFIRGASISPNLLEVESKNAIHHPNKKQ